MSRRLARRTFVAGTALFAAASKVRAGAQTATFTWKCGDAPPAGIPVNVRLVEAFTRVRNETKGRLDIRIFPNSALGGDPSMVNQLRLGALEMMAEAGGQLDSFAPLASIENVPFAFPNYETAWRAFDGDLGKVIQADLYGKGLVALKAYDNGFRQFTTSTKPIRTVEDIQGMKLRVPTSNFRVDAFKSLGASPTPISASDLYTALQTKLVDGQESPLIFIEGEHYYEIQKYCSLSNHMWTAFWILVNREKWESLPRDFQEILRKNVDASAVLQRKDNERLDETLRDKMSRQGLTFNTVQTAGFKAKLVASGFYARWKNTFGATAWAAMEKYSGPLG